VTYQVKNNAYEWQLRLPPSGVIALLTTACVDASAKTARSLVLGHMLWGPKAWKVQVNGDSFVLTSLNKRDLREIFSPNLGTISAIPSGSLIRLRYSSKEQQRHTIRLVIGIATVLFGGGIAAALCWASGNAIWSLLVAPLVGGWFFLGFYWLVPNSLRQEPVAFLEALFENCTPNK